MARSKSVVELAERDVDVRLIALDAIDFDTQNPNGMDPTTYEALKAEIRDIGFFQPVLVAPRGDRFRMVDGEHRARVVADLGGSRIPAVVADAEDDEAQLRLLTMNLHRGSVNPVKFAFLITDLASRVPEAEIRRRLALSESEFRDSMKLASFTDDVGDVLREAVEKEAAEAPVTLRFVLNHRDAELVMRVVDAAVDGKSDRGQALARICRTYERNQKSKGK